MIKKKIYYSSWMFTSLLAIFGSIGMFFIGFDPSIPILKAGSFLLTMSDGWRILEPDQASIYGTNETSFPDFYESPNATSTIFFKSMSLVFFFFNIGMMVVVGLGDRLGLFSPTYKIFSFLSLLNVLLGWTGSMGLSMYGIDAPKTFGDLDIVPCIGHAILVWSFLAYCLTGMCALFTWIFNTLEAFKVFPVIDDVPSNSNNIHVINEHLDES